MFLLMKPVYICLAKQKRLYVAAPETMAIELIMLNSGSYTMHTWMTIPPYFSI